MSQFGSEWIANEATVVQGAELVQHQCECQTSSPRFEGVLCSEFKGQCEVMNFRYQPVWAVTGMGLECKYDCGTAELVVLSPTPAETCM